MAHLRTNYDIVFSFAKSQGVDLNYGASPRRSVCPSSGFYFPFLPAKCSGAWHSELQRVTTQKTDGAQMDPSFHEKKADGRGMCAFVQTSPNLICQACGVEVPTPKMQSEQLGFLCTGWYVNLRQNSIEFLGVKKEISRPHRRRNGFIPLVRLLSQQCFPRKRRGGGADTPLNAKQGA